MDCLTEQEQTVGENLVALVHESYPQHRHLVALARSVMCEIARLDVLPEECVLAVMRALWHSDPDDGLPAPPHWTITVWHDACVSIVGIADLRYAAWRESRD
ncbi:hypothetical protein LCGC14_1434900 [marine sediment metagenome]|uniref:Uncharacterized protein n=1 Tax=marine sediment metagenome TaxID=412755 RepID=A0A0F9JMF8_9ZZZZ